MLFNTVEFFIFFLIIVTAIVIIKNKKFQHLFLLLSSYFFFYFSSNYLITLLFFSTILDFYIGKKIWETKNLKKKKLLLIASLSGNLGLLGFFKYSDFAILQFNFMGEFFEIGESLPFLNLILPIGISFYTFQTISYTVDIYRGKLSPSNSLKEFALYVSFFPQLVAGPIVRAKDFLPQLREKLDSFSENRNLKQIILENSNLRLGITLMALGFFKKMFFADNISPLVNSVFSNPIGSESLIIILATIGFGIQIYADFSGYSDIAIGAALVLGFKLPLNFNKPYFAISPSDFWNRWHISLSTWLRDYLYIPLGGSRKSHSRTYVNLIIVMFLGGLWHGASWNFVIWGLLHGLYLAIHRILKNKIQNTIVLKFFQTNYGKVIGIITMQYFIFLAWIPFRVQDFDSMLFSMQKYIFFDFQYVDTIEFVSTQKLPLFLMGLFFLLNFISYKKKNLPNILSNLKLRYWILFLIVIMSSILFFYEGNPENFIYFQF